MLGARAVSRHTAALLHYLDYLLERHFQEWHKSKRNTMERVLPWPVQNDIRVCQSTATRARIGLVRGVHPLWGHDAFPPCFRFSPNFRKNFRLCGKFSEFYLFPKKFSIFIRQNFWWPFFSHRPQIYFEFPPIFPVSVHFLPVLRKLLFPPAFEKLTCFLHNLCVFCFPLLLP